MKIKKAHKVRPGDIILTTGIREGELFLMTVKTANSAGAYFTFEETGLDYETDPNDRVVVLGNKKNKPIVLLQRSSYITTKFAN